MPPKLCLRDNCSHSVDVRPDQLPAKPEEDLREAGHALATDLVALHADLGSVCRRAANIFRASTR
jgi:hypothetical protein